MATVVYPGSFDPVTCGHVSLVRRAASVFGNVIVAVATNSRKSELFTSDERVEMLRMATAGIPGVEVDSFSGLLVDYMRRRQVRISIRGLRAVSDFEYEFQMALTNRKLAPDIEVLFMMPRETYSAISSSVVRELAALGGDVRKFVPDFVLAALKRKVPAAGRAARRTPS